MNVHVIASYLVVMSFGCATQNLGGDSSADSARDANVSESVMHDAERPQPDTVVIATDAHRDDVGPSSNPSDAGHTTLNCNALGPAGQWQNITPAPAVGIQVSVFELDTRDTGNIYLTSCGRGVFKSSDCGSTWVRIDDGMSQVEGPPSNGPWTMVIDPVDPQVLYMNTGYGPVGVFKTVDGGVHWRPIYTDIVRNAFIYGGFTEQISLDPTDHLHLTTTPHFSCMAPHSENCMAETFDGGDTWTIVENTPGIGEGDGQVIIDRQVSYWGRPFGGLWRTSDGGDSWQMVSHADTGFRFIKRAANGIWYAPGLFGVQQSSDGITWATALNGPNSDAIAEGDNMVFASRATDGATVYYSRESDMTHWTPVGTGGPSSGGWLIRYDSDHHVLYSTNGDHGFWRIVMNP